MNYSLSMDKQFRPLDPNAQIHVSQRHLPHWYQPGAAVFVTFRTVDSMPRDVLLRWHQELVGWLRSAGLPKRMADAVLGHRAADHDQMLERLSSAQRAEFKKLSNRVFHRSLDDCHGSCLLRQPELAKIVADAIRHFDGQRYDLDRLVVMPNHVHVIVQFRAGHKLETISQSWMRFTARLINRNTGQSGAFWQAEPFDHVIRSESQFLYLQQYIFDNPTKAKLPAGHFLYWQR